MQFFFLLFVLSTCLYGYAESDMQTAMKNASVAYDESDVDEDDEDVIIMDEDDDDEEEMKN